MTGTLDRPAFYAVGRGRGGLRDWVTLLHPPYTAWHLSYVAVGAALSPVFVAWRLEGTLLAFFLAVGIGAHALDELTGRPLRTGIRATHLYVAAVVSITVPVVVGLVWGGWRLLPFVAVGSLLVASYNLELFGGALHTPSVFALAWGAFPLVTGYYVQDFSLGWPVLPAAAAAFFLSLAQNALSKPVRELRRSTAHVTGQVVRTDGSEQSLDRATLVAPLERALRGAAAGVVCLSVALVASRL
jgi:hypothetical protein